MTGSAELGPEPRRRVLGFGSLLTLGINGIVAECGGCCQCATCHVYVAPAWQGRLSAVSESEDAMLDNTVCDRRPESRLSCEIKITQELDGLVVHVPMRQV